MGSIDWFMGHCQLYPSARIKTIWIRIIHLCYSWVNHLEFDYGDSGYVNQLIELSKMWKETRRMDLRKHVFDVAPSYLTWKSNRVKDLALPLIDNMVQPACILPNKVPIEDEILRLEIEVERKATNLKILRLQEDLGQCHYDTKILKNEIRKKDQKYDLLLEDFKKLGLENKKNEERHKRKGQQSPKESKGQ